jgi:hypothetical protein
VTLFIQHSWIRVDLKWYFWTKKWNMEMRGIDPRISHMLSERSTIWATSPFDIFDSTVPCTWNKTQWRSTITWNITWAFLLNEPKFLVLWWWVPRRKQNQSTFLMLMLAWLLKRRRYSMMSIYNITKLQIASS